MRALRRRRKGVQWRARSISGQRKTTNLVSFLRIVQRIFTEGNSVTDTFKFVHMSL
jgi:hypothetical protein